ncbi:L.curvatus small cryptic plasmid rep protein [Lactococcus piscium]|uniref:transcriptional regulator n=1 Tax=Pseudolactococcus carnosus TaxID=2749961 RepID=UPI000BD75F31|nr:transcriptional regulator [Lactococcus carnosus]MCJ2003177.1 transcriptional regulator [Lactococcus carnosus]SOB47038.1 L.curvatus small cryptic plasmid rep protein [Lactococcus piscium]
MAREKSTIEYQNVSMRIPKELYLEYKKVLAKTGSIVTYDVRNYMKKVVEEDKIGSVAKFENQTRPF